MSEPEVVITPDNFIEALGLADVAHLLVDPSVREAAFSVSFDYLKEFGAVVGLGADVPVDSPGLPFKIPKSAYVVQLSKPTKEELGWLLSGLQLMLGVHMVGAQPLGVATLLAVVARIRKLRAEFGELSVVNALSEGASTAPAITARLHGRPCRYPAKRCQFMDQANGSCAISLDATGTTLQDLAERGILRAENPVEPISYRVSL